MARKTRERIYGFVRERILAGMPPSVREVQEELGFKNVKSAQEQLARLIRDGLLARAEGCSRGLRLPRQETLSGTLVHVPILGRVQAGGFQPAVEDIEGYWPVRSRVTSEGLFALRVQGESMTGAHILPGDLVLVRRQPDAENGQVVVALVEDEATVKIFRRRGRSVELHPANPAFPVLKPDLERLEILGRVIEVRRVLALSS